MVWGRRVPAGGIFLLAAASRVDEKVLTLGKLLLCSTLRRRRPAGDQARASVRWDVPHIG
jgi:hypothetical protein